MPHQCTNCSETFPDGSKEMLSGCPHCGGNTFQYLPSDSMEEAPAAEPPEPPERPSSANGVTETVGKAATTVRDYVSQHRSDEPPRPSDPSESPGSRDDAEVTREAKTTEDTAQASARGELADATDLPEDSGKQPSPSSDSDEPGRRESPPREDGRVVKEPDSPDRPDLEELRQELNDQFESIKILEPGQYELNLMGLYDREEHIIALQEDGKYMIEVPETWRDEHADQSEN